MYFRSSLLARFTEEVLGAFSRFVSENEAV